MPSELAFQVEEKHRVRVSNTDLNKERNKIFPSLREVNILYDLNLTEEDLDYLSTRLEWGTYGPEGDGELQIKKLVDLDTDHLEQLLIMPTGASSVRKVILHILKQRYHKHD